MKTIINGICANVAAARRLLGVVAAVCFAFVFSAVAHAQESSSITEVVSSSQWTTVLQDIASALSAVMIPVIGLAVGLMLVAILFKVVKRFLFAGK